MKISHVAVSFALSLSLAACASPSAPEAVEGQSFTMTSASAESLAGRYEVDGLAITFSARAVAGGVRGEIRTDSGTVVELATGEDTHIAVNGAEITALANGDADALAQLAAFGDSAERDAIVLMGHDIAAAADGDAAPLGSAFETVAGALQALPAPEEFATMFAPQPDRAYAWTGYVICYAELYDCWQTDPDDAFFFKICRGAFYDCIAQV